ncbi:recombinase family protein [Lentzea sp. JNUCC 0626]|uniref:recombinase family protein n=1 Tax=Lentzea sp. JNUCC 0626 TaxID=3367513 RepID=UPI0037491E67
MARSILLQAPPNTVSINIRLSKQAKEENLSKDGMLNDCIQLAARMNLRVIAVHIDDGTSGAIRNRKGFTGWLDDAREGRCDHLLAWHVDRMTREGINVAGMILDTIEGKDPETGKVVRQPVRLLDTQGLDSGGDETSFRIQFVIKAEIARAERERMRDRNRNANARARAAGRWPGGPTPYGFKAVDNPEGAGKVLVHHDKEVCFIREAAARVLVKAVGGTRKNTLGTVVRWANTSAGHPPRRAKKWTRRALMGVLCGWPVRGYLTGTVDGKLGPILDETGRPVRIPEILTPDTSAAIRALAASQSTPKGGRQPSRLLSGLMRCLTCHSVMYVGNRKGRSHAYRCSTGGGTADCSSQTSINADQTEAYVADYFLERWGTSLEYTRLAQVTGAAEVEAADAAVAAALIALSQDASLENLAALKRAQERQKTAQDIPKTSQILVVPTGRTITEAWEAGSIDDRRELLETNFAEILVSPGYRGSRYIDTRRLKFVIQPPHVLEHLDEDWRPGAVTVAV